MRRLLAVALLVLAGCGGPGEAASEPVVVFAASSLSGPFGDLADEYEKAHQGVTVTLNFGASSALARSITDGAPADVFAAANPATMKIVGDRAQSPAVFARNSLQIAVPKGNPGGVRSLADLGKEELTVALCAEQVPCGSAAKAALAAAGVTAKPDTLEADAKATTSKVALGEVDAALVYRTDVLAAGDAVAGIDFPEADQAVNDYPIAVLRDAPNRTHARGFAELVRSKRGQEVLRAAGFRTP